MRDHITPALESLGWPSVRDLVASCPPRTVLVLRLCSSLCVRWPTVPGSDRRAGISVVVPGLERRNPRTVCSAAVLGYRQ